MVKRNSVERHTQPFVQIPCRIVARAGQTLKSAHDMVVLLHIINRVRIENSREVKLTNKSLLDEFGVERWSKLRSLDRLERAGFITVEREPRRTPRLP
jgi:hypothetical protein